MCVIEKTAYCTTIFETCIFKEDHTLKDSYKYVVKARCSRSEKP